MEGEREQVRLDVQRSPRAFHAGGGVRPWKSYSGLGYVPPREMLKS